MNIDNIFRIAGILAVYTAALFLSIAICANLSFIPTLFVTAIMFYLAHAFLASIPDDN